MAKLTIEQALNQAVVAHNAGDIQTADRLYTAILKVNPKHPDANHKMGLLAVSINKAEASLPFFKAAVEANLENSQFWYSYIDTLIKLEKFNEAKEYLAQAKIKGIEESKFNELAHRLSGVDHNSIADVKEAMVKSNILDTLRQDQAISLARKKIKNGSHEEARLIYEDILEIFPNNKKAHIGMRSLIGGIPEGSITQDPSRDRLQRVFNFYNERQFDLALKESISLIRFFPKSVPLLNLCGAIHASRENYETAIKFYKKALAVRDDNIEILCNLGIALQQKGNLTEAVSNFKKVLKIDTKNTVAISSIANIYKQNGDLDSAIDTYKEALKFSPNDENILYNLGNIFQDSNNFIECLELYKKAVTIRPSFADAHYNMGVVFYKTGKIDDALNSYQEAIQSQPNHSDAHHNVGVILKEKGELDSAIKSYKRALKSRPDYAETYNNLGLVFQEVEDLEAAIDNYSQAITLKPDYAEAYNNMGSVFFNMGKIDESIESYKKAIEYNATYFDAYNNMGVCLREISKFLGALENFEQALLINPDAIEVALNLVRLPMNLIEPKHLALLEGVSKRRAKNKDESANLKFLEAHISRVKGNTSEMRKNFREANKVKAKDVAKFYIDEQNSNKQFFENLKEWSPNFKTSRESSLKKLFILGPSRSGKTSLESLLSESKKVKALREAIKMNPLSNSLNGSSRIDICFDDIFYDNESILLEDGYEIVTSTRPSTLKLSMGLFDRASECYFVVIKRNLNFLSSDIFMKNYRKGNFYSYEEDKIEDYLNFYYQATDVLLAKLKGRSLEINSDQIRSQPTEIISKISKLLSVNLTE